MDSNLSKQFGSVRSAHSYDRHISSQRTSSSFVTVNQKRSWRPPPYLFQPVLDSLPSAAPLALAAANPFLRLYVERNEDGGGFLLDGYQVTPISLDEHQCCCDDSAAAAATAGDYGASGSVLASNADGDIEATGCGVYGGPFKGTSGLVVEEDGTDECWGDEDECCSSVREDGSDPRTSLSNSVVTGGGMAGIGTRMIPLHIRGIGSPQSVSPWSNHQYPYVGVDRVAPASTQAVSLALKSNAASSAVIRDRVCLRECWRGTAPELSLCVSIVCKSDAALHFSTLGAWWLSRYYGVSLRLHHMHPAQLPAFKEVQRTLFIKELQFEYCTLSEDFLQCISTCSDLLSLSIVSCSASQEVTLRCIDSILRRGPNDGSSASAPSAEAPSSSSNDTGGALSGLAIRGSSPQQQQGTNRGAADIRRDVTNWYLSGVRSLGMLRRLRCLHILHTPLHETFLQALTTCTSLECLLLHRCRGVRSLEALQKLPHLQSLGLHGLSITDTEVMSLGCCPSLRQLVLDECRNVTDLSFLTRLQRTLERLLIPRTLLSNSNMRHVGMLDKLVELDVQSLRQLTDLESLRNLTALRVLSVRDNLLTNEGCATLRSMPSLQRLNLACCRCLTSLAAVVGASGKWAQRLYSLTLSQTNVTDDGLVCIKHCTDLRYLNLSACTEVRGLAFLQKMTALRWLHLGGTSVSEEEANRHLPSVRALRFLSLAGCSSVRTLGFAAKLKLLEYLDLEATSISDNQLVHLCGCRRLRLLVLQRCSAISVLDPLASLPSLLELNVSMTAVGSAANGPGTLFGDSEGRRTPRSGSLSPSPASTSLSNSPSPPPPDSTSNASSPTASTNAKSEAAATRFPSIQVLHLNGCSRLARLEGLTKHFPQLRVLHADRISIMSPRTTVGVGFNGADDRRRARPGGRQQRGTKANFCLSAQEEQNAHAGGVIGSGSPAMANKSASQLDQVLQQYLPRPPVTPRPRTAHAVVTRPHPPPAHHRGVASERGPSVVVRAPTAPGEAAHVLRLVVRRSSLSDQLLCDMCATFACVTSLDLSKCVDVQSLSGIGELYALKELLLSQSSVDNDGVRAASACLSLEVLRLSECRNVTDVNCLASLGYLRALNMERTQVTNQGFEGVGGCRSLQFISCSECRYLSNVNPLGSLKRLQELHLELTDVRDAGIRGLLKCTALQRVYFTRCQHLTTVGEMRAMLPQLEVLDVYGTSIPTRVAGQGQHFACAVM